MISKKDVQSYLIKMLRLENDMGKNYDLLSKKVNSKEYKKNFEMLSKEENDHAILVKQLQGLLKNWK